MSLSVHCDSALIMVQWYYKEKLIMYVPFNPNPINLRTDDCVVRAISKAMDKPWEEVYIDLCLKGLEMCDWGNANAVWDDYLKHNGFKREIVPDTCPDCYAVSDFCVDNPTGTYILGTGSHVVAVVDGSYYDSWDSGQQVPIYAYRKE